MNAINKRDSNAASSIAPKQGILATKWHAVAHI